MASGQPPPIVFVHGAFVGGWIWAPFRAWFRHRGFDVHTPDLRHHQPDAPRGALHGVGLEDYTDDLQALVEGLGQAPVLVGHSMGGLVCQKLAARGLGRALVLLAASPPAGILPGPGEMAARLTLMQSAGMHLRKSVRPKLALAEYAMDRFPPPMRQQLFRRFVPESGRALFETMFWELDHTRAAHVPASKVAVPVLSAIGSEDRLFSTMTARAIASRYPGPASVHVFPGLGHYLLGEPGAETMPAFVEGWLSRALG
jgi:pimeloyl-ACP methyl ester carboxylesterase